MIIYNKLFHDIQTATDTPESSESESEEETINVVEQKKNTPAKTTFPPSSSSATESRRSSTASDKLASKSNWKYSLYKHSFKICFKMFKHNKYLFQYILANTRLKSARSDSIESSGSSETPGASSRRNAGAAYSSEEVKQSPVSSSSGSTTPRARFSSVSSKRDSTTPTNSRSYNATGNTFKYFIFIMICMFIYYVKIM